ncbi:HBS1-like protein, partial [Quaeritorhiza haematococci]
MSRHRNIRNMVIDDEYDDYDDDYYGTSYESLQGQHDYGESDHDDYVYRRGDTTVASYVEDQLGEKTEKRLDDEHFEDEQVFEMDTPAEAHPPSRAGSIVPPASNRGEANLTILEMDVADEGGFGGSGWNGKGADLSIAGVLGGGGVMFKCGTGSSVAVDFTRSQKVNKPKGPKGFSRRLSGRNGLRSDVRGGLNEVVGKVMNEGGQQQGAPTTRAPPPGFEHLVSSRNSASQKGGSIPTLSTSTPIPTPGLINKGHNAGLTLRPVDQMTGNQSNSLHLRNLGDVSLSSQSSQLQPLLPTSTVHNINRPPPGFGNLVPIVTVGPTNGNATAVSSLSSLSSLSSFTPTAPLSSLSGLSGLTGRSGLSTLSSTLNSQPNVNSPPSSFSTGQSKLTDSQSSNQSLSLLSSNLTPANPSLSSITLSSLANTSGGNGIGAGAGTGLGGGGLSGGLGAGLSGTLSSLSRNGGSMATPMSSVGLGGLSSLSGGLAGLATASAPPPSSTLSSAVGVPSLSSLSALTSTTKHGLDGKQGEDGGAGVAAVGLAGIQSALAALKKGSDANATSMAGRTSGQQSTLSRGGGPGALSAGLGVSGGVPFPPESHTTTSGPINVNLGLSALSNLGGLNLGNLKPAGTTSMLSAQIAGTDTSAAFNVPSTTGSLSLVTAVATTSETGPSPSSSLTAPPSAFAQFLYRAEQDSDSQQASSHNPLSPKYRPVSSNSFGSPTVSYLSSSMVSDDGFMMLDRAVGLGLIGAGGKEEESLEPFRFDTPSPDDVVLGARARAAESKQAKKTAAAKASSNAASPAPSARTSTTSKSTTKTQQASKPGTAKIISIKSRTTTQQDTDDGHSVSQLEMDMDGLQLGSGANNRRQSTTRSSTTTAPKSGLLQPPAVTRTQSQAGVGMVRSSSSSSTSGVGMTRSASSSSVKAAKSNVKKVDVVEEYKKRAMEKESLNLVVVGHVDAGKSTLMGHVLYLLGEVSDRTMKRYERDSEKMKKSSFAFAWVLDETEEERSRGITMDVAITKFQTEHRRFTLLDAPGHRDFIPNMISGAAQADVAILVVDSTTGEFEAGFESGGQTREHALLIRSLGVAQLVVAVNKLDVMNWSQARYQEIVNKLTAFLTQAGFRKSKVTFIPTSGYTGENLLKRENEELKKWYSGPTLVEQIDRFEVPQRPIDKPFRLSVVDFFKGSISSAGGGGSGAVSMSGRIESGHVQIGDQVAVMPINEIGIVR